MNDFAWWQKPRNIAIVVDNDSWILPYAEKLGAWCQQNGDNARLCRRHKEILPGAVAFYLGCTRITPPEILALNRRNIVAHASNLPEGRGFSPWTYAVLAGVNEVPLCLIEAVKDVDAGPVIYKDVIRLDGTELVNDIRALLGEKIVLQCQRFLQEETPPSGVPQEGEPTYYPRRTPADSRLDPDRPIADQFDLLRVVDNKNYPAFFDYRGRRYKLLIEPDD